MTDHTSAGTRPGSPADGPDHPSAHLGARRAVRDLLSAAPGASVIAVGLHREGDRALLVRGHTSHHRSTPADGATRFEAGSLTKTFTALLLAEQAAHGELGLHDPLMHHLPTGTRFPRGATAITLTHLATHTAGLPGLPPGLRRRAGLELFSNPYAGFSRDDVLHALTRTRLRTTPGARMRYSNFGVGLLGHALTHAAGDTPYAALLHARVLRPLGLHDTTCAVTPPETATQATGHRYGRVRSPLLIPGLPAAGAVRTSARDLLTLTEALVDPGTATVPATLRIALREVPRPRLRLPHGRGLSLIWNIRRRPDGSHVYHHSGATFGFTGFAGFNPQHSTALVALANTGPSPRNTLTQQAYNALLTLQDEDTT
ncbi:serine hydrolase domain-containing protein [Streptomyces sp. NPDC056161]|uniref:serine hydrolase domain-containing protein n=1 Tax=Streptomyces sp. NPDC056161 TaxID=3345732 RepID=UPI0035DA8D51